MGSEDLRPPPLRAGATSDEKDKHYRAVKENIGLLVEGERNFIAVLATIACELHHAFQYFDWTGFYLVDEEDDSKLVIGPYQGTHGCLRIPMGKGVCGTAAKKRLTQVVPDVELFPGHIACASTTRSEIVVPIRNSHGAILGVLDIDSNLEAAFDHQDELWLELISDKYMSHWDTAHRHRSLQ